MCDRFFEQISQIPFYFDVFEDFTHGIFSAQCNKDPLNICIKRFGLHTIYFLTNTLSYILCTLLSDLRRRR